MSIVIKFLLAVIMLGILVISHEFGHFLLAKANGIEVVEFWVGFGPKIVSFEKNGTLYRLNMIPFGGGCLFDNMDPDKAGESSYRNAPVMSRIATVLAGPVFNFILAYVLALFIVGYGGYSTCKLLEVTEGTPAYEAGLKAGDNIIKVSGQKVYMFSDISLITMFSDGSESEIVYERDGVTYSTTITPEFNEEYGRYMFGIVGGHYDQEITAIKSIKNAYHYVIYEIKSVVKSLEWLIVGKISTKELSGPIGVATIVSDEYDYAKENGGTIAVIVTMISLGSLLSANLGVMNLLPIPGLDGSKLLLLIVEGIRRKPISEKTEGAINMLGLVFILILMFLVMYNDVYRLIAR